MELRQLRHFLAVAEARNFSRAAQTLHIAQPALSISIRKLEEEIGAKLLERGTRNTTLTEAGQIALESARSALAHIDDISRLATAVARGEAGLLRIAFVGGASYRILPRYLPEFRRRYPEVKLELLESTSLEIVESVRSGLVDCGIVRHPLIDAAGLSTRLLEDDPLVAAIPRGHRLASKPRLCLHDLAKEPFIQFSRTRAPSLNAIIALACRRSGFEPNVAQEALQIQTIISLVESGLGVALVPESSRASSGQAVEFRPLADHKELLKVGLALVFSAAREKRLAQNFVSTLAL
ncbi:LysR family transcriptional regulator [Ramlibacter sp. AN1015]|uniref:LysR family transcriptional regulator n=1 Tax=Ramlibacter sp. AN1015 TaxID=3133428 RepID=UPI0030C2B996